MTDYTGTAGNDTLIIPLGSHTANGLGGTDIVEIDYSSLSKKIKSGGWWISDEFGNYVTFTNIERFRITGGSGNDDLWGNNAYSDTLIGGGGNDTLRGSGYSSTTAFVDNIDGGAGTRDLWIADYSNLSRPITITLNSTATYKHTDGTTRTLANVSNIERMEVKTGAGADKVSVGSQKGNDVIETYGGNDTVTVGTGLDYANGGDGTDQLIMNWSSATNDIYKPAYYVFEDGASNRLEYWGFEKFNLTGGTGNDYLVGGGDADTINGGAGNDTISSGAGKDVVDGGNGTEDRWIADYAATSANNELVFSAAANTNATNWAATGVSATAKVQDVEHVTLYTGGGKDKISTEALSGDDDIRTGSGDDIVYIGNGRDYADGGAGTDLLKMDWSPSTTDITKPTYYLYDDGETNRLEYWGFERYWMIGGSGNDVLEGGGSNDTLVGGAGNDILRSGAGKDSIDGGLGQDRWVADYNGSELDIVIKFRPEPDTLATNWAGTAPSTTASVKNIEHVTLYTGNGEDRISTEFLESDDDIRTRDGDDEVHVGDGRDYADGAGGNDTLVMDWSQSTTNITKPQYYLYDDGASNRLEYWGFEYYDFAGGAGNDTLVGGNGADTLRGQAGNDTLNGIAGGDAIDGGDGVDLWQANYGSETDGMSLLFNTSGNASTTVPSDESLLQVSNIERIELYTGSGDDVVSTAALGARNDWLRTGGGLDEVNLGRGRDYADGGDGEDFLTVNWSTSNTDVTKPTYYLYDDGAGNRLEYWSFERYKITTGSGSDYLEGGALEDILNGGNGEDTLAGGAGGDQLTGGSGPDLFVYGGGMDEITDFAAGAGVGDRLRTAGWGSVDTWAEVQAALVSDGSGGSILMIEDEVNEVHFIGVGVGAFAENDFLFV